MRTILVLLTLTLALPAAAHTSDELETWFDEWGDDYLNGQVLAEFRDMLNRHPQLSHSYEEPQPRTTPITARGMGGNVEQWTPLILVYFPETDLNRVLCIMTYESGGNPNAYNPSGASGLMQIMASWADNFGYEAGDLFNPSVNLEIAKALRDETWRHWNPVKDGRC